MVILFATLLAYLSGSIPFGKIVGHYYGVDIQKRGSGNIGFANVRRVLGWRPALATLSGDIAKGFFPALIAVTVFDQTTAFWLGLAAIVGHIFPIWLGFRGGKGVATAWGVLLILQPVAAIAGGLAYIIGSILLGKSSSGSILGAIIAATVAIGVEPANWWQFALLLLLIAAALHKNILGTVPNHG